MHFLSIYASPVKECIFASDTVYVECRGSTTPRRERWLRVRMRKRRDRLSRRSASVRREQRCTMSLNKRWTISPNKNMAASTPSSYVSPRARVTVIQYTPEALNGISHKQSSRGDVRDRGQTTLSRAVQSDPGGPSKPNCSYNCLVGMALKSSKHQRLPVNEIYSFFL